MSIYERKEYCREKLFLKSLNLTGASKNLVNILPIGFTFQEFLKAFKDFYPYSWEDICSFCQTRNNDHFRRKCKKQRTIQVTTPEDFLKRHAKIRKTSRQALSDEELVKLKSKLTSKAEKTLLERKRKLTENLVYSQIVCPSYIKPLISAYFDLRRKNTLDVNARYLILLEAAQFKCDQTISFLHRVSTCEKNNELRLQAFYSLQHLGERPWLPRKRKGKKKLSVVKPLDIRKNPTTLLELLYKNQELLYQKFDVFLSHSSFDSKELILLKSHLNSLNKVVYIDWVNDREMLNRKNQNEDTWPALELRMSQSDIMLYVLTDNAARSQYTEREVNYFKKSNKKVLIYKPYNLSLDVPAYLADCEYCDLKNNLPIL